MSRTEMRQLGNLKRFQFNQAIKKSLASKLSLDELYAGRHILRNENGWRDNEIGIDYIWIAQISRSFVGWGGLITIKYDESQFRDIKNIEKLTQGIFLFDSDGEVEELYMEEQIENINDPIWKLNNIELFTANKGMALDGVSYDYSIIANNIETQIIVDNPTSENWKKWEKEIWNLGNRLAHKSGNAEMIRLFG